MSRYRKILVIPDSQVKPGVPTSHLNACGRYIAEKQPDVVVHLGDHWDFPSLSSYDRGKKAAEGRRVLADIKAGNDALEGLTKEIRRRKQYDPRLVLLRGNHEDRMTRAIEEDAKLDGVVGFHLLNDRTLGWEVHDFLKPVVIDGIAFCHYFCRSANGTVVNSKRGAPSARAQVNREMMSTVAGHKQGLDIHVQSTPNGIRRGIIAGSFYQHEEDYLTPQGRDYWRGVLMLHECRNGEFDLMEVSLAYLLRRYA